MTTPVTHIPKRAAALFGAAFAIVFLFTYDPEELPPGVLSASKWFVLLPAAFLFALRPADKPWLMGLVLTGGVFFGVCLAAILYASNLWPIAGVYWTWLWLPPIVVGTAAGMLLGWASRGTGKRPSSKRTT